MLGSSNLPTVAIIGTSFGCWTHAGAFRGAGWNVKRLVGRDPERTALRARQFDIPFPSTSYQDVLDDPQIDAVVISTPPGTHLDLSREAFAAGKHVLCEKPMALTLAQAEEMADLAAKSGRIHRMGTNFRWSQRGAVLRRAMADGLVGVPIYGLFQREYSLLADTEGFSSPDWWGSTAQGAGWLFNAGSHYLDLIRFAVGEFAELAAMVRSSTDRGQDIEDSYTVQFRLKNGLEGVIGSTSRAQDTRYVERIVGTAATLTVENGVVTVTDAQGARPVEVPPELQFTPVFQDIAHLDVTSRYQLVHLQNYDLSSYIAQARSFADAIAGKANDVVPPATFEDGVAHMRLIEAIRESSENRRYVTL
jgi:predicted dehydrogenase